MRISDGSSDVCSSDLLIAGLLSEAVTRAVLRGPRRRVEHANDSVWVSLLFVLLRAILDIVPVAAFAAVAYGALTVLEPTRGLRIVAIALINAIILPRFVATLARMVVSPNAASLRLIPAGDGTASSKIQRETCWARVGQKV